MDIRSRVLVMVQQRHYFQGSTATDRTHLNASSEVDTKNNKVAVQTSKSQRKYY